MAQNNNFWKMRAQHYEELEWANHRAYLDMILRVGEFKKTDVVLDVGTGTGKIARLVSPYVWKVIGIDKSEDMLAHCDGIRYKKGNIDFIRGNILHAVFQESVFHKVTARMVLHHIVDDVQEAVNKCYWALKKGGKMILAEGVPPCAEVKQDYIEIFKLKEERLTFMEEDLVFLMRNAGFKNVRAHINIMPQMSVCNWLEKSGLPPKVQDKIFEMHVFAGEHFRKAYNMKIVRGDCLIDMKNAIVVGEK
jgi:SAM-dependent methyltransferase